MAVFRQLRLAPNFRLADHSGVNSDKRVCRYLRKKAVPCGFVLWNPIFVWRLALRGAGSILAGGLLYRRLAEHRRLCSLDTPSRSLLA
jgi:hypothetical protein